MLQVRGIPNHKVTVGALSDFIRHRLRKRLIRAASSENALKSVAPATNGWQRRNRGSNLHQLTGVVVAQRFTHLSSFMLRPIGACLEQAYQLDHNLRFAEELRALDAPPKSEPTWDDRPTATDILQTEPAPATGRSPKLRP